MKRKVILVLCCIAVLAAVALFILHKDSERIPLYTAKNGFNVVLIGIDTLRYDHINLGLAETDAEKTLTPNLDRLADRAVVFQSAVSQAPWTLPAFASIFTGKYPFEHQAMSLKGKLEDEQITLTELLRGAGYQTMGIVSHMYLDHRRGFDQGFDLFNEENVRDHAAIGAESTRSSPMATSRLRLQVARRF